jgi:hypothetical protein
MFKHLGDSPVHEEIDEEGFAAERRDRIECTVHLTKCPLNCRHSGNMSELTGHTEILRISELRPGEHLVEYFEGAALMRQYGSAPGVTPERGHLHREGALLDCRDLTQNFPLCIEPIIERRPIPVPSLTVELIGPLGDAGLRVFARRQRQHVKFL